MIPPDMHPADRPIPVLPLLIGFLLGAFTVLGVSVQPAQAQDSGPSKQQKAMHYSLYHENFKNEQFESAKGDLEWIMENAPGFPRGDARNFRRHYQLYEGLAQNADSDEQRLAYLDTAATVLATATEKMDQLDLEYDQYRWEIRKGRFMQDHEDALPELSTDELTSAMSHYRKAFELAPSEVDSYYIQQVLRGYLNSNQQDKALEFLSQVENERGDDDEVNQIISSVRNDIFGKNPQAQISYLEDKLEANPDNMDVMQSLFDAYVQQGNISKASDLAPRLMKSNPPAEIVRQIAEMRLEDGRPEAALEAYDRAVEQGAELKAEDYHKRGEAHQKMNNFSKARSEFRKAVEMLPDFGEAYVSIGDLYARAVSECSGSELGRKDKAVYWAAVDKYEEAIGANSSISSVAESKIESYRKYFPTQEDIFYREDWEEGSDFTIDYGCYSWISETTTVRRAP